MSEQRLSIAETYLMQFFWAEGPLRTEEVSCLAAEKAWKPTTLLTFLSRLVAKGMLGVAREGKQNVYTPRATRDEYLATEGKAFLNDLYGGSARDFIAAMVNTRGLSKEELAELRRFIDEQEV